MSRGRGRGRGRGKPFGGLESLLPGEPAPPPILTPPPLFPPMEKRPLELHESEVNTYLLTVKQELRHFMQQSPFALKASTGKNGIERYSDKYKQYKGNEIDDFIEWHPDWNFFPNELRIGVKRRKRGSTDANFRPSIPAQKRTKTRNDDSRTSDLAEEGKDDVVAGHSTTSGVKKVTFADKNETLDPLAKLDEAVVNVKEEKEDEEEKEGEEGAMEEFYDEEIEEEDTDYNVTYFDNGEDYGGDEEDALEEGPYY